MADTSQQFQYTGGCGCGPCGSAPAGSNFVDENTGPPRPDLAAPAFYYEDEPLVIEIDE